MSDDYKIYVDAAQPATLNNGGGALTDCPTLQEAVLAWHQLPPEQKIRATVKLSWEIPEWAGFFTRLAGFSRLILFEKRGTGLPDRVAGIANLEERMDDVPAVMDAARSERDALFGVSEGRPVSLLFTATYPPK